MDNEMEREEIEIQSRRQLTKPLGLSYLVHENPPWYICLLLGFQHFLVALGGTLGLTFILSSAMCFGNSFLALSEVLSTIFFVSGIVTLLQSVAGIRLPIIHGASFTFLAPTLAILSLPQWTCPSTFVGNTNSSENSSGDEIWKPRMREIQGAIMVSSCFQIIVGFSGLIGLLLRFVGPLTTAPTITLVGLPLFRIAADYAGRHWGISMMTIVLIALFSQCLSKVKIPVPAFKEERGGLYVGHFPLFRLFSIILAIAVSWGICGIITAAGGFTSDPDSSQYLARTDSRSAVLNDAKWFRFPYPGQWGTPTISAAGVLGMLAAPLASTFEAVGSYYACARLSGVSTPPKHAINRGIGIQGIGCVLAGAFGGGNGMTVFNENIGAIGITKAASLRVVQFAALFMAVVGLLGKIGALFVSIPDPIVGGVFMVMFGMITAVGISNLQFANMNSSRNLFIVGFSLVFGLALPYYLANHPGSIRTGVDEVDQILTVLLSTSMVVGCMLGLILDNLIPGTAEERGLVHWHIDSGVENQEQLQKSPVEIYDLPFGLRRLSMFKVARYLPFLPYKGAYGNDIHPPRGNESLDTRL